MMRVALLAFVAGLAGCETAPVASSQGAGQPWVCGIEYVNHAWGYQRRGLIIDGSGKVLRHDVRADGKPPAQRWMPADAAHLTEQDLAARYEGARATDRTVPPTEISAHLPLIAEAAATKPGEGQTTAADMGSWTTYCLLRDARTATYAEVLLDERGDLTRSNPSPAARQLSAWVTRTVGSLD